MNFVPRDLEWQHKMVPQMAETVVLSQFHFDVYERYAYQLSFQPIIAGPTKIDHF